MQERIQEELTLIRQRFPDAEYQEEGHWFRIPSYPLPQGWNREFTEVAFQVPVDRGYPGTAPYGIYVPSGLQFQGARPNNYTEPADNQPRFSGTWGVFSWAPEKAQWKPTSDIRKGANLLNWVLGFAERFREGR